jgi:hypothetical protein
VLLEVRGQALKNRTVGLSRIPPASYSNVFSSRNSPAASLMRENSIQKAWTSMKRSCTLMILLRISDCRNTHTSRTSRFCKYLSLMFSQDEMQLTIYLGKGSPLSDPRNRKGLWLARSRAHRWMNSVGKSTAVVNRFTTSIECKDMSMFTCNPHEGPRRACQAAAAEVKEAREHR